MSVWSQKRGINHPILTPEQPHALDLYNNSFHLSRASHGSFLPLPCLCQPPSLFSSLSHSLPPIIIQSLYRTKASKGHSIWIAAILAQRVLHKSVNLHACVHPGVHAPRHNLWTLFTRCSLSITWKLLSRQHTHCLERKLVVEQRKLS